MVVLCKDIVCLDALHLQSNSVCVIIIIAFECETIYFSCMGLVNYSYSRVAFSPQLKGKKKLPSMRIAVAYKSYLSFYYII